MKNALAMIAGCCGFLFSPGAWADGGSSAAPAWSGCPFGDGLYCGFNSKPAQAHDTLYRCQSGVYTIVAVCESGCDGKPNGQNDLCKAGHCPYGDGVYCGPGGFAGCTQSGRCTDANTLYACIQNAWYPVNACMSGCQSNPDGIPDQCKPGACTPVTPPAPPQPPPPPPVT